MPLSMMQNTKPIDKVSNFLLSSAATSHSKNG